MVVDAIANRGGEVEQLAGTIVLGQSSMLRVNAGALGLLWVLEVAVRGMPVICLR